MTDRIRLPSAPEAPERAAFPLLASAAPVVGALAMWALTQLPFTLLFAALGPLVAVGGMFDARRRQRAAARAGQKQHRHELAEARSRIDAAHDAERRERQRSAAPALDILTHHEPTHERWRHRPDTPLLVSLGTGTTRSALSVDGPHDHELADHAATLTEAPILCDAREGIGIVGTAAPARALLRALVVQLAHAVSPAHAVLRVSAVQDAATAPEREWLDRLPHARPSVRTSPPAKPERPGTERGLRVEFVTVEGARIADVALASREAELPPHCRVAVRVTGTRAEPVRWPQPDTAPVGVRPRLLAREAALRLARLLARTAHDDALLADTGIPSSVTVTDLGRQPAPSIDSLVSVIGLGPGAAPLSVDLVGEGPHALVGGTTGSGKSELLCAWILGLCTTRSPRDLGVLLVDYKGGASFRTIERLPNVVGTITDLDAAETRRALDSLTAELRHREHELARHGVRDITELRAGGLPRLLIVVDEYAALVGEHPDLQSLFADIAARGRSLGMHLILSTQRPSGIVRDSILANVPLRISLRVLDPSDSTAVLGVPDAAHLTGETPGRALLRTPHRSVTALQPPLVTAQDVEGIIERHDPDLEPPRRPWQPPLPDTVTIDDLQDAGGDGSGHGSAPDGVHGSALGFALADRPREQRRHVAAFDLDTSANLLVVGARGSGRTTALAALAGAAQRQGLGVDVIPSDIEGAWDGVHRALADARSDDSEPRLCVLDDVDLTLSRMPDEHRDALNRALAALLAEGPARGIHCALAITRVAAATGAVTQHCDARLVLRTADRHEHHAAGADPALYRSELPPGRGWFQGDEVHVVTADPDTVRADTPRDALELPRTVRVVVSTLPTEAAEQLARAWGSSAIDTLSTGAAPPSGFAAPSQVTVSSAGQPRILIADPDTWLARLPLFSELARTGPVAYHACSLSHFRQLSGVRDLPPPIATPAESVWLTHPVQGISRARLPRAAEQARGGAPRR